MKTKLILTSMALAAAFTGCTDDEFAAKTDAVAGQAGELIELSENFMIGAVGAEDPATRTHWVLDENTGNLGNVFSPIIPAAGQVANNQIGTTNATPVIAPTLGLCWIGESVSENVYTNYEFIHNGWLGKGQEKAAFNDCDEAILENGWLYSELSFSDSAPTSGEAVIATTSGQATTLNVTGADKTYPATATTPLAVNDMNLNSGVYKTENKAIFGGNYIAYYPYDPEFKDKGAIPAKSEVVFDDVEKNKPNALALAENTFRYSNVAEIAGGKTASAFQLNPLSGVIRVVLKSKTDAELTGISIDQVLLYSPSAAFKKEVRLSAAKISAGATGTALYASTVKTSKTLVANMKSGDELKVVKSSEKSLADNTIYLTALPTSMTDLTVLVHDKANDKWAEYSYGNFEVAAATGKGITATFAADDFKKVYYAADYTSLAKALAVSATQQNPVTVKVLGDIELAATSVKSSITNETRKGTVIPAYFTIEGDKIIVPEDQVLQVSANATMKSAIDIDGQSCCGKKDKGGHLIVLGGATIAGNVKVAAGDEGKMAGLLTFRTGTGACEVAATSTITVEGGEPETDANVRFGTATNFRGTLTLNESATAKQVNDAADVNVLGGTINNNGTYEVQKGKFAMLNANGVSVAAAGQNFKNNGTFIDNVGTTVTGATQHMVFGTNGDYICKVNGQVRLDVAYAEKTACSTIQFVQTAATEYDLKDAVKHNNKDVKLVDAGVATTLVNNSGTAVTVGKLTVNAKAEDGTNVPGLTVKNGTYTPNTVGAKPQVGAAINVNGDIEVNGKFTTAEDLLSMTATNLTVFKGGVATFENREKVGTTLYVTETITVKEGGTLTIVAAGTGKVVASVSCKTLDTDSNKGTVNGSPIIR